MQPRELTLKIDSLSYGPYGVGRKDGKVVLVPLTVPEDEIEVRIVEEKNNYAVGELSRLIKPSPLRQEPPCPYFGKCGGCAWQQIRYEAQLASKEKSVEEALRRIGKLDGFDLLPILRSPEEYHYRRRIRLQANKDKRLGFHRAFSHELIEIDSCLIADPKVDRHLSLARQWATRLKTQLQHVEIVVGDEEEGAILVGEAEGSLVLDDDATSAAFLEGHKELKGLILFGKGWRRAWGQSKILTYSEGALRLEVDGEIFTQVNRQGNRQLVRELLRWGEFHEQDLVLELYCGAGNFTLPVAKQVHRVTAVEGDSRTVRSGKRAGQLNGLENIRWIHSHVPKAVKELSRKGRNFSKIILDPPRSGAKGLENDLASLGAEKILYVSCNPATLARDLAALSKKGYRLTQVRPIDLFPHTFHVEILAEMVLTPRI